MTEELHVVSEAIQRVQATHEIGTRAALKLSVNPARERDGRVDGPTIFTIDQAWL